MIESLSLRGLLSFGWEDVSVPLRRLNVLIGPNGSGKSNLLDALDLLQGISGNGFPDVAERKGGAEEWIHKGPGGDGQIEIEAVIEDAVPLRYRVALQPTARGLALSSERLETRDDHTEEGPTILLLNGALKYFKGGAGSVDSALGPYDWVHHSVDPRRSMIGRFPGDQHVPQVNRVADALRSIHLYQSWQFGPNAELRRRSPPSDAPALHLLPDASNLGLVLHRLLQHGEAAHRLRVAIQRAYEQIADVGTSLEETAKFFLVEKGFSAPIPPSRMSDGTLRWLALLAVLLDPEPPGLIALEEPELGLHPDLIHVLVDLLREASERTQIIVTTQSETLVSAFSDSPEDVVVCERPQGVTTLRRLDRERLAEWLKHYSLGQLWMRGELGGTRW